MTPIDSTPACWRWRKSVPVTRRRLREQWEREAPGSAATMDQEEWDYWLLVAWQDNRCAICGVLAVRGIRLVVDHDHKTGLVRGLLCIQCNTSEGRCDSVRFVKYRQRNPAVICGVRQLYYNRFTGEYAVPQDP